MLSDDEAELPRLIEAARAERAALRAKLPDGARQAAAGGPRIVSGTPEQIAEKVYWLHRLGIEHLLVRFLGEWHGQTRWIAERSMRLFSERVIPRFDNGARERPLLAVPG
jgi:alkanesulfonate monooxygenase SsuD/methylene tetrahydromethanopterin reductase-like flavin-dependent oxidoreductase (luciferase family)